MFKEEERRKKMKTYVKPELKYESFMLSESIATSCAGGWIVKLTDTNSCYAVSDGAGNSLWDDVKPYTSSNTCNQIENEQYCITVLSGADTTLFGSV